MKRDPSHPLRTSFGFSSAGPLADFRLEKKANSQNIAESIFEFLLRQSEIQNRKAAPQTKMAGAFGNRFRARGGSGFAAAAYSFIAAAAGLRSQEAFGKSA